MSVSHCSNYSETGSLARDGPLLKHPSDTTLLDPDPETLPKPFSYPFTSFENSLIYVPLSFKSKKESSLNEKAVWITPNHWISICLWRWFSFQAVLLAEEKYLPLLYHIILNYYIFIGLQGFFFPVGYKLCTLQKTEPL